MTDEAKYGDERSQIQLYAWGPVDSRQVLMWQDKWVKFMKVLVVRSDQRISFNVVANVYSGRAW